MNRFIIAAVAGLLATTALHADVTEEDLANDQTITTQVVTNGMGRSLQRYSPLDMLNKDNVDNLVPAWPSALAAKSSAARKPSRSFMTA